MTIRSLVSTKRGRAAVILVGACVWHTGVAGWSQVIGDEAEMDRLKAKADEAIGTVEPEDGAII
jgi:hypothetical protein